MATEVHKGKAMTVMDCYPHEQWFHSYHIPLFHLLHHCNTFEKDCVRNKYKIMVKFNVQLYFNGNYNHLYLIETFRGNWRFDF